jgi:molybdopterin-containing oxidoreductase family iron-sulfur binding subunit
MTSRPPDLHALAPRHEVTRRDALKLIAGGIAALQAGCLSRAGDEEIVPYVDQPENRPGVPVRYTGALALDGFGIGVIVETHEGRPTKIDGNPAHPASLGGSPAWLQARILDLYDPQRAQSVMHGRELSTWGQMQDRLLALARQTPWLVMPPQSSPTVGALLARLRARHGIHVVHDAPLARRNAYRGHALVYGAPLEQQLDLERADVIVALDADFMATMPMSAAWARAAAARRTPGARMSRWWVCEPVQTPTGTLADEHVLLPAGAMPAIAACVLDELATRGLGTARLPRELIARARGRLGVALSRVQALAADLAEHRGRAAVIVGDRQPPVVHALARWIDHACGNPVTLTQPALLDPLGGELPEQLVRAVAGGAPVIVIDCDPVYSAPRSLGVEAALRASADTVYVGAVRNATALACKDFVPLAHELETWTDPRACDGTLAIGQPAIRPRFDVASPIDVLAAMLADGRDARMLVRDQLGDLLAPGEPNSATDARWTAALRTGIVADTRAAAVANQPAWSSALAPELARELASGDGIEIALAASPSLYDGRFAPNAWLQELPHPITKQTWGNAALLGPGMAARLGVADTDLVTITSTAGEVVAPVLVLAAVADDSITLEVGHGQDVRGVPIADHVGTNAYVLRGDARLVLQARVARASGNRLIVRTQHTMSEHGHEVAPVATLARLQRDPDLVAHLRGEQPSLLPPRSHEGVQWGMSIDTSICTGCSSCMVACQAENNIATVGPEEVERGRHMNWIRIDRYVSDDGAVVNEPMPCQHCEDAPCEYVCPVMATTHSPDGLNEQVYNRCVGTRFCSNNCPYKVRRFNWFAFEAHDSRALQYNPDVTVRSRGVMEKCTYCVQRIRRAEHAALVEKRPVRTGEVVTACQQACPTGAIQFGQLAEDSTPFARMRRDERRFDVLHALGTRPRTQYLAKIRNPRGGR